MFVSIDKGMFECVCIKYLYESMYVCLLFVCVCVFVCICVCVHLYEICLCKKKEGGLSFLGRFMALC